MAYPIEPPLEPMLATPTPEIPEGEGWLYEPKWDGFRALIFRDGPNVHIASRNQLPLERYFPEVVEAALASLHERCVVDGEIVIEGEHGLEFDALQLRLHPAESRVRMLAREMPATLVLFDILAVGDDDLRDVPLTERRTRLREAVRPHDRVFLTPQTTDAEEARAWFERFEGAGLDGVVAKRADVRYVEGKRVMAKIKHQRTADCVVGGYRVAKQGGVGSLLLGLYDDEGVLHNVGFASSFKASQRTAMLQKLRPYEGGRSFGDGRMPGGPSRWNGGKDTAYVSLRPELVCEVSFDHLQGDRFRHGARFLRWRPDKDARACTYEQLQPPRPFSLEEIRALADRDDDRSRSASRHSSTRRARRAR